jgi:hypothetical protein
MCIGFLVRICQEKAKKNMQSWFGNQKCQEFIESEHEHAATSSSGGKTCPTLAPTLVKTHPIWFYKRKKVRLMRN